MQDKNRLYVFPTSRAIREYISAFKKQNTLLPYTITIDEFLKKSVNIDTFSYETKEQRAILLSEAIKEVNLEKLGLSKSFAQFLKQHDYIYRFFLELSSEQKNIEDIKLVDTYSFYEEHLEILNEILKNYKEILEKNSLVNRVNIDKKQSLNIKYIEKFEEINIKFEGYFTKQEFETILKISKIVPVNIEFYKNIYNEKSLKVFDFLEYGFKNDHKYIVDISNKKIVEEIALSKNENFVDIKGFSSRLHQLGYIKSTIVNLVNSGVNPSNIAVILPSEDFATTLKINDNEGYFNFAMGKDILNTKLYQKAYTIFNYLSEEDKESLESLSFAKVDELFIKNNIKDIWGKRATKETLREILEFLKIDETNSELIKKYDEMVYFLNTLFFSSENFLRTKDAYKIFLQNLSKIKLDDINSGKVTVMGVLESRLIEFDATIICDFNEEFVPKISTKDKFLSSKVKKLADLPTKKDRENLQKYYYKRLIQNSKKSFISYFESKDSSISRFAYELFGYKSDKLFDKEYQEILYKSRKIEYKYEEIEKKIDLTQFSWSASSLRDFLVCKRRWYYKYIFKIKEHSVSNLPKAYELGNIIHRILEEYYKNRNQSIDELFIKYRSINPFLALELEIMREKVENFIKYDKKRLENRTIIELEKSFDIIFCDFKLTGVIDRVDKNLEEDLFELIDYKTSRNLKVDNDKNYEKSDDFQMAFYYLAIKQLYKSENIRAFFYDVYNNIFKEEVVVKEKINLLEKIFINLKEQSQKAINFAQTEKKTDCTYCIYRVICNKE